MTANSAYNIQPGGVSPQDFTIVDPTASVPGYILVTTPAATSCIGYLAQVAQALWLLPFYSSFLEKAFVFTATQARYWIGLTDDVAPYEGFLQSANPARHICAFRYDPSVPDTHWTAYCSTDATHFTAVDTGVTPDFTGAPHIYEQRPVPGTPGTIKFYIDNVLVATISTNVPSTTTGLGQLAYVDLASGSATSLQVGADLFSVTIIQ
jgi:hypothetical protein